MMANSSRPIRLLIVDDDEELRGPLVGRFERLGMVVAQAASVEEAVERARQTLVDVAMLDLHFPGMDGIELLGRLKELQPEVEALLVTAHSSVETAVQAMKHGAYDYLTKPFRLSDLEVHIQKAYEKVQHIRRERQWTQQVRNESPRYRLVGSSAAMRKVIRLIEKVVGADTTVLERGPGGTGKELVARALHANGPRFDRPLVTINCATLQESLLEPEIEKQKQQQGKRNPERKTRGRKQSA